MPLKNGELNASELRRLVREHNKLVSLKIPKGTNRDGLIKLIKSQGYEIDHKRQRLFPIRVQSNKKYPPVVNLPPAPPKKTAEEKEEAKKQKRMKAEKKEEEAFESRKKKIEAVKKVKGMKDTKKSDDKIETLQDLQAVTLKFIRDHKAWLEPTRMSGAKNGYEYYLKQFKKEKDSVKGLDFIVFTIENKIENFKKGTGGIVNPFKKGGEVKNPLPMPKVSYKLYNKIKGFEKKK